MRRMLADEFEFLHMGLISRPRFENYEGILNLGILPFLFSHTSLCL